MGAFQIPLDIRHKYSLELISISRGLLLSFLEANGLPWGLGFAKKSSNTFSDRIHSWLQFVQFIQ